MVINPMKFKQRNKEVSWLSFNARLLQEAADPTVPLLERIKFLGIFSSNLEEFFRVKVATLKRLTRIGKKATKLIGDDPKKVLESIYETVLTQQAEFDEIFHIILKDMEKEKIFIINETQLDTHQTTFVRQYFHDKIRQTLIPIMLDQLEEFPNLKDQAFYLAVCMRKKNESNMVKYALIEIPSNELSRFCLLPKTDQNQYIILLDDIIRYSLHDIFAIFKYDKFEAYTIKITRDAELEFDTDLSESFIKKMTKSLTGRKTGTPVRFIYDRNIPEQFLKYITDALLPKNVESYLTPCAHYINFKDFINFPQIFSQKLYYHHQKPLAHKKIDHKKGLFESIQKNDILLHYPYQSFDYVIDFLREAAIDSSVTSIYITLYRVATRSKIINALINNARNGKKVVAVMELQARFDEEANIYWANLLQEEGVHVIHGVPPYKVHSKLILITRKMEGKSTRYAAIGTGNFNESTAKIYTDHILFTCDQRITNEIKKVFELLEVKINRQSFRHLQVSPFNMRQKLMNLIDIEIKNAQKGKAAYIFLKLNNLTDSKIINKLYKASQAGVDIKLMVRGMFSLITEGNGVNENIRAIGIVDKYLEHSRIFIFCNGGDEKYFLTSADWMSRNLDQRVEVACPIYDREIQRELKDYLEVQWRDNVKARILNKKLNNRLRTTDQNNRVRAQEVLYNYFENKLSEPILVCQNTKESHILFNSFRSEKKNTIKEKSNIGSEVFCDG